MKFNQITNSVHLEFILKRLYSNYRNKVKFDIHVVPIDKLKDLEVKDKMIVICNFQKSDQIGNHWTLILNYESKYVEYFDSYGVTPPELIYNFMKRFNKEMIYTTKQIQTLNGPCSNACGWFCLKYLYYRLNKNQPAYEAVNNITCKETIKYGHELTNRFLKYIK